MEVLYIANTKDLLINEKIKRDKKYSEVMVIGPKGEQLGVKNIQDALVLAEYSGFDLVLINPTSTPGVCKIMDYNKFKYEKKKKQKDSEKKQKDTNTEIKEYRLSPVIDIHDFETRAKNASKYLLKNCKIKVSIKFKGREVMHAKIGEEVMLKFAKRLEEIADIEKTPKLDNKTMTMYLAPKKNK